MSVLVNFEKRPVTNGIIVLVYSGMPSATRSIEHGHDKFKVEVDYSSSDNATFNRTYRQICNSLTIE